MADNTIITQGNFTSTGKRKILSIRSDLDWMYVYNMTAIDQTAANLGATFYWQRGMTPGSGVVWVNQGATADNALSIALIPAGMGFTLVDQGYNSGVSSQVRNNIKLSAPLDFDSITDAIKPVIDTTDTADLQVGDVVYLSQTSGTVDDAVLLGIPFQVDLIDPNVSFRISNPLNQSPGNAGTDGFWRRIVTDNTFYPQYRYIVDIITDAAEGALTGTSIAPVIVTSVDHGYQIGQEVTFNVPSTVNGMTQINTLSAPIIHLDPARPDIFQVRLDVTGFTPFNFPNNAELLLINNVYTPATVVPAGMNSAEALAALPPVDFLSDATVNTAILGIQLSGGSTTADTNAGPAGAIGDVMFWVAGKSFSVDNTI